MTRFFQPKVSQLTNVSNKERSKLSDFKKAGIKFFLLDTLFNYLLIVVYSNKLND